ncbi:MAG TPA: formate dehydrogenase accessory sulfurtransferase FdhD [Ktedonobacterales bacterium]|nr:formate dehydrogenase accessory sulfurtransferase FdhD [Ktedonobacterales bacterium]
MSSVMPTRSADDPLRQVTSGVVRWQGDISAEATDELVAEEPLELRAQAPDDDYDDHHGDATGEPAAPATIAVIMRTPGQDDELAMGFLLSEGLIARAEEIAALLPGLDADGLPSPNVIEARGAAGVDLGQRMREAGYSRQFAVNASCGVCGKNTVEAACALLPPIPLDDFSVAPAILYGLPDQLLAQQRVFGATGGLHGAALFDSAGQLIAAREDVGRHNAVDKLVGRALLAGAMPLSERILLVSGRLSFEIVLKALVARVPIVAAVSAPSSLAIDLARSGGVTLVGFLRGEGCNVYTWPERIRS